MNRKDIEQKVEVLRQVEVMLSYVNGADIGRRIKVTGEYVSSEEPPLWDWAFFDYYVKGPSAPSIDWDHVSEEYNYLARNRSGAMWLFKVKPTPNLRTKIWEVGQSKIGCTFPYKVRVTHSSAKAGTCDWKDSLVERPQ